MAALVEIVEHFTEKTTNLKRCMEIKDAVHSPTCLFDLKAINKELSSIEQLLTDLREQLNTEKENLDKGKALVEVVHQYQNRATHVANHLPSHLPADKREPPHKTKAPPQEPKTVKRARNNNETDEFAKLSYLTVDEFEGTPKYIKGRITYQQINSAVDEINKAIKAKYKIMNLPRSAMGEPIMKKFKAFKEAETEDTKGLYFFVDDDVKNYSNLKLDKTGRSVLTILRHCGRLKELRSGGLLRYVLK